MVKQTQTIRQLLPTNCLRVFDHFVGLALKGSEEFTIFLNPFMHNVEKPPNISLKSFSVHSTLRKIKNCQYINYDI